MDDIVDHFEEFIKKSLVVISVALGTLILMIMYVFKMLAARPNGPRTLCCTDLGQSSSKADVQSEGKYTACKTCNSNSDSSTPYKSNSVCSNPNESCSVCSNPNKSNSVCSNPNKSNSVCTNPDTCQLMNTASNHSKITTKTDISAQVTSHPRFEEKTLREVGLSGCSKVCRSRSPCPTPRTESKSRIGPNIEFTSPGQLRRSKHNLADSRPCAKYIAKRTSCCSMCCVDDNRR
ncbi:hypothetical protein HW555_007335 [Spodoptera exigua]|uniref:Uncharacterized protein n=1 Tax=Spodoptera exigua TaxID=7107 RepID=A0A835GCX9_SPOEX|nr:hypothetical protein HW555_007335 [Spodoptera exigua]